MVGDPFDPIGPGALLAGKYRVERVLGEGGMGIVVAAVHEVLGQRVAIKVLRREALKQPEAAGRFLREARAAVRIESEHVARVLDVGTLADGIPFIVMEFLRGQDLSTYTQEHGAWPIEDAVDTALEALGALAEAHAIGIVHRDLKPANLFLVERSDGSRTLKILDFGISKIMGDAMVGSVTSSHATMGSPLYMPPEQIRSSRSVDQRADIWGMGVVLYELLAARPPFDGQSMGEILAAVLEREAIPLRSVRSEVPPSLEAIIMSCLAKDPNGRLPDAASLARALAPFGTGAASKSVARVTAMLARTGSTPRDAPTTGSVSASESARTQLASPPLASSSQPDVAPVAQTGGAWTGAANEADRSRATRTKVALGVSAALLALLLAGAALLAGRRHDAPPSVASSGADSASSLALPMLASAPVPEPPLATASPPPTGRSEAPPAAPPDSAVVHKHGPAPGKPKGKPIDTDSRL